MSNDKIVIYQAWSTVAEGPVFLYKNIRTLLFCAFQTFQASGITHLVFDTSSENKCEPNSSNSLKLGILKNMHTHVQTYIYVCIHTHEKS